MSKKSIVILLVTVVTVVTVALIIIPLIQFRLTGISPSGNKAKVYEPIVFSFNKDLDPQNPPLFDAEPTIIASTRIDGKKFIVTPVGFLDVDKTYKVKLQNIHSANGNLIQNVSGQFTTVLTPYNQLPDAIKKRYQSQTDTQTDASSPLGKLIASLPYRTNDYTLSYLRSNDRFVVEVSSSIDNAKIKTSVAAYFKSYGIDASTQDISYNYPASATGHSGP